MAENYLAFAQQGIVELKHRRSRGAKRHLADGKPLVESLQVMPVKKSSCVLSEVAWHFAAALLHDTFHSICMTEMHSKNTV